MVYYAHTREGCGEDEWERLSRHLAEVRDGARQHGQSFGAGAIAALAGYVHVSTITLFDGLVVADFDGLPASASR
jgi:hypothetical protein